MQPRSSWKKWLSYLWPVREESISRLGHPYLEVRWEAGRKVLNGERSNYSYASQQRLFQLVFKSDKLDLKPDKPVLILGLGAGSVVELVRNEYHFKGPVTGVEKDPEVLRLAQKHFPDTVERVSVVQADALSWIRAQQGPYQLIVVDLFDDNRTVRGSCEKDFIASLPRMLLPEGSLYHNLMLPEGEWQQVELLYRQHFGRVETQHLMGLNQVIRAQP